MNLRWGTEDRESRMPHMRTNAQLTASGGFGILPAVLLNPAKKEAKR